MKNQRLSFFVACAIVMALFSLHQHWKPEKGRAFASMGMKASAIMEGQSVSTSRKRTLRQAVSLDPDNFLDVSGLEILSLLNQPEMVRTDSPTTIWQYRNEACVLDLYFTTQEETALEAPVVHYEIRSRLAGEHEESAVKQACARDFIRAHSSLNLLNLQAFYK